MLVDQPTLTKLYKLNKNLYLNFKNCWKNNHDYWKVGRWLERKSPTKGEKYNNEKAYEASSQRESESERDLIDDQVLPMKNAVPPVTTEDEII